MGTAQCWVNLKQFGHVVVDEAVNQSRYAVGYTHDRRNFMMSGGTGGVQRTSAIAKKIDMEIGSIFREN